MIGVFRRRARDCWPSALTLLLVFRCSSRAHQWWKARKFITVSSRIITRVDWANAPFFSWKIHCTPTDMSAVIFQDTLRGSLLQTRLLVCSLILLHRSLRKLRSNVVYFLFSLSWWLPEINGGGKAKTMTPFVSKQEASDEKSVQCPAWTEVFYSAASKRRHYTHVSVPMFFLYIEGWSWKRVTEPHFHRLRHSKLERIVRNVWRCCSIIQ